MATVLQIPITKGGKGAFLEVNTASIEEGGDITEEVMREAVIQGLKVILNRGTTKITSSTYEDVEERQAAAMKKAQEQFELMRQNQIKFTGAKPKKEITGEVMTEAMRVARALVRQGMKDAGIKVSHVKASEVTKVAKELVNDNPDILEAAKATVAARKEKAKAIEIKTDLKSLIDPKLVAKDEADRAEKKAQLSAAKAGKIAPAMRVKQPQATAH